MKLTKNFNISEFIESKFYSTGQQNRVVSDFYNDPELLHQAQKLAIQLQVLRDYLETPIHINISYRPIWYELEKGRSGNSRHVLGQAADITAKGWSSKQVHKAIEFLISEGCMLQGGLGAYNNFTHYDIGYNGTKRRWDKT